MVGPPTPSFAFAPLAEDATESVSHPTVQRLKVAPDCAVFVVFKPAAEDRVDLGDDVREAIAIRSLGMGPESLADVLQTLVPGPPVDFGGLTPTAAEVVSQKLESVAVIETDDLGLLRVKLFRPSWKWSDPPVE